MLTSISVAATPLLNRKGTLKIPSSAAECDMADMRSSEEAVTLQSGRATWLCSARPSAELQQRWRPLSCRALSAGRRGNLLCSLAGGVDSSAHRSSQRGAADHQGHATGTGEVAGVCGAAWNGMGGTAALAPACTGAGAQSSAAQRGALRPRQPLEWQMRCSADT